MKNSNIVASLVVSVLVLSACGERPPEKPAATQVVAKVNDNEITVHQLNFILQRTPNVPAAKVEAVKRQVLENLVDQQLAVDQAMDAKLDRTPGVMEAIENARREILARAYIEQVTSKLAKPTDGDVHKFYAEHPELFANRKIYRIEEIVFAPTPENIASAKELLEQGKNLGEIITALKAKGIEVGGGASVKAAEQLDLEQLPKLAAAPEGKPQLIETSKGVAIFNILASKSDPMDEAKAQPVIESFLVNKQRLELARDTVKQLRAKAKIEYIGEFANTAPTAASLATPTAVPEKSAETDPSVTKGITGLK